MKCIQLYEIFSFKGRLSRWRFLLANICITLLTLVCATILAGIDVFLEKMHMNHVAFAVIALILTIAMMVMAFWGIIAIKVKRLHDLNFSGCWIFAIIAWGAVLYSIEKMLIQDPRFVLWGLLCMFAQWIPFLLLLFIPGTKESNRFGPTPSK